MIACGETKPVDGQPQTTRFQWVASFNVTAQKVIPLAHQGGRLRGKIDAKREGFNVQKNGGYALEHAYTQNPTAAKVFYFLLQIGHLLSQLIEHGSLLQHAVPQGVGSAKNLAFRLLEAWRNLRRTPAESLALATGHFQIRFDSS